MSGNDHPLTMVRDASIQALLYGQVDIDMMAYEPVVVYLNGEYWGFYGLREKYSKHYVESHHGVDKDSIDFKKQTERILKKSIMERKNLGEEEIKTIHVLLAILLDKSNIVTISFKHLHLNYEIILEEYEYAKARGAKIYAEVLGGGMSSDAYHMTAPHPEGIGVIAVMRNCLENAGLKPEEVDHINTHGTSTSLGDVAELKAISKVFGEHAKSISINSTKSMTGHLLGAAGAIESIASILAMEHGIIPPTINHNVVDENIDSSLNLILNKAEKREVKIAMSNTFGFGGHNACVVFRKLD